MRRGQRTFRPDNKEDLHTSTCIRSICCRSMWPRVYLDASPVWTWRHQHLTSRHHQHRQQSTWSDQWTHSWCGHVVSAGRWHSTIPRCTTRRFRSDLAPRGSDFLTPTNAATSTRQSGCALPIYSSIPTTSIDRVGNRNRFRFRSRATAPGIFHRRRRRLRQSAARRRSISRTPTRRSRLYQPRRTVTRIRSNSRCPPTAARWELSLLHFRGRPPSPTSRTSQDPSAASTACLEWSPVQHHHYRIRPICLPWFHSFSNYGCSVTRAPRSGRRGTERTTGCISTPPTSISVCCNCIFCNSRTSSTASRWRSTSEKSWWEKSERTHSWRS